MFWEIYTVGVLLCYMRIKAARVELKEFTKIKTPYTTQEVFIILGTMSLSWLGFIVGAIIKVINKEKYWFKL